MGSFSVYILDALSLIEMESFWRLGLSGELSRCEVIRKLRGRSSQQVCELVNKAVGKDLAKDGDKLVMRRKIGGGKTVKEKHMENIWALVGAITRCKYKCHVVR